MIEAQHPGQFPVRTLAFPQVHELRYFRSGLTCPGERVSANLDGAVVLHRVDLETPGHQSPSDAIVTRTRLQGTSGVAIACASSVVIELRVFSEQGSELVRATGDKRRFKECAVHACKFVVKRPAAGCILCETDLRECRQERSENTLAPAGV